MGAQAVRLSNADIDNALKDKDFEVLFQPIFDLGNGALARVETFIRWRHPSLGVLPPGAFISFFETQGRMSELTRYVLAEALAAYQGWRGSHAPGFSINLALSDLADDAFAGHFTVLLRERGYPAELVTLECPMPPVDADVQATARQLQRLADTGARLAIEVRGRANEFLKTVRPFPFAEIKTGGAAILRFARTVRGPGLSAISELLELAAEHHAVITAVGVEDQASLAALRGLGFAAAQGNHLARVGALAQFLPSQVNEVRALLGLEPLSQDDLAALFRTGAPTIASPPPPPEPCAADAAPPERQSDVVERLAARLAQSAPRRPPDDDAKAAAIARARRKSLLRERLAERRARRAAAESAESPQALQERLSRAFEEAAEAAQVAEQAPFDDAAAMAISRPAETDRAATPAGFSAAHLEVADASARFAPTIRVGAPALDDPREQRGDLEAPEAFEAAAPPAAAFPAPPPSWTARPAKRPAKSFLTRTVIPFSALKPKYFWPRFIRKRMKKNKAA